MSAEKKTSKGAPFSICERKFPEDPVLTRTAQPVDFSKFAAISFIAYIRSAAAATVTVPHSFFATCTSNVERGTASAKHVAEKHKPSSFRGTLRAEESLLDSA